MPVERVCISAMSEHRRASKPIMEKRRRARINNSLSELKSLILDATRKDCSRHSKLEKADILEMTVKHLQTLQRQQMAAAVSNDPTVLNKFKSGFSECASEISRYLNNIDGVDKMVRQRILNHLATCLNGLHNYLTPLAFPSAFPPGFTPVGQQFFPPGIAHHHHHPQQPPPPPLPPVPQPPPHMQLRNVPAGLMMLPGSREAAFLRGHPQHFFPSSGSPMPLSELNCSSPSTPTSPHSMASSLTASTPNTPLSPVSICSKISDLSEPVWRPW